MRLPRSVAALVVAAACDRYPGSASPVCADHASRDAALDVRADPYEVPLSVRAEVIVLEHARDGSTSGTLVLEDSTGARTTLGYVVPSPEVAPPVEAGARLVLMIHVEFYAFQATTEAALWREGRLLWVARIGSRSSWDPGIELRPACRVEHPAGCGTGVPIVQDIDALVTAGGSEVTARVGEVVQLPGGATFVLAWWWVSCGCCLDPPDSRAWVYAAP